MPAAEPSSVGDPRAGSLAEAEAYLRQLVLSQAVGGIGSFEVDLATGHRQWSHEHFLLHKRDPDGPTPTLEEWMEDIHPDDRPHVREADPNDFDYDYRLVRDPHDIRVMHNRGRLMPGPPGHPGYVVGLVTDVTEERRIEAARRASEERFQQIFDLSPIGMLIMGFDGHRYMVNDAFCTMLGFDRETFLTMDAAPLAAAEDTVEEGPLYEQLKAGTIPSYRLRRRFRHAEGHTIWGDVSATTIEIDPEHQVRGPLFLVRDITNELEHEQTLQQLADHDHLTGLLNRRAFERRFHQHIAQVKLGHRRNSGALLVIDLDHFKYHNDTYGHAVGDAILVAISNGLQHRLRASDVIGRIGGDEFAVVLPDVSRAEAETIAGNLVATVRDAAALASLDAKFPVTASIGVADFHPHIDGDALLREADQSMYLAKEQGRNQWARIVSGSPGGRPDESEPVREAIGQLAVVRDVVVQRRIEIACQPIFDFETSRIIGWEALTRGSHPTHGPVSPVDLVGLAVRHDLIDDLTRQVLEQAIESGRQGIAITGSPLMVNVNIELEQLYPGNDLITWLADVDLPEELTLLLEVTERGGDEWTPTHEAAAAKVVANGIQLGLDDYGTGFSRLGFLRRRTWHLVKLDQRFVRTAGPADKNIVGPFVTLLQNAGTRTLAEGIETVAEYEWSRGLGIDMGQGFLIARPMPVPELLELLRAQGLGIPAATLVEG